MGLQDEKAAATPTPHKADARRHSDPTTRPNTEQAFRLPEIELQGVERLAHIGSWQWLPDTDLVMFSEGFCRLAGRDSGPKAIKSAEHAPMYTPESWSRLKAALDQALAHGVPYELDLELVRPDGSTRWVKARGEAGRDQHGHASLRGTIQDVTEQRLAEEVWQQLAAIVDSSDDAIFSSDLSEVITGWNYGATRMFGYTAEEAIGRSDDMLVPPELREEEREIVEQIRTGRRIDHHETERLTKEGRRLEVSMTISPMRDAAGRVTGASKVVRDISERKRADAATSYLAAIVECSDDAIISKNLKGIITSWNAAATRLFGYTPEEAIGRSILMLIPPELHSDEDEILARLQRGQRIDHFQTQRMKKNGELVEVSLTISPVRDSTGRIIGASKIARDITDRRRAERALLTSEKLAAAGRLAATVAHEINNPLESIINLVYLARRANNHAAVEEYLSTAEQELNRVAQLSKQSLSFYRETTQRNRVDAGKLLSQTAALFSSKAQNKGIRIQVEVIDDVELVMNHGEFQQLFANLISNSIDACGRGGVIHVRASAAHKASTRGMRVMVADNGCGIRPADRSHVFEPFFTTKKEVGTGLGLWLCSQIAEKYGGSIHLRSDVTPGRSWTAVSVFLPLAAAPSRSLKQRVTEAA